MKSYIYTGLLTLLAFARTVQAQNPACLPPVPPGTSGFTTTVFFNYGGQSNAIGPKNRNTFTVGEPVIGAFFGRDTSGALGFYSRFLLPPFAPEVFASEGNLADRIQVEWVPNLLSPFAEDGFNIYRDGAYIASVEKNIRVFIDFNVLPGVFYNYQVAGKNEFGEGISGSGLGFLNPNGVVTGQVRTQNGNPVPDASITLSPTLGTALSFSGDDGALTDPDTAFVSPKWTFSCWVKIGAGNNRAMIADLGSSTRQNWWITTGTPANKGIRFFIGSGSGADSIAASFSTDPDGWHHVAATYTGMSILLYVDGNLVGTKPATQSPNNTLPLYFGRSNAAQDTRFFNGSIDDARLFRRQMSQTEINQYKNRTVNSDAEGLVAYWKFDEAVGAKAYDISPARHVLYLCGPEWSGDRPNVVNGAVTDATGFYRIEGINYGSGQTFTATPEKNTYEHYALEFNNANEHYALLPDSILMGAQQKTVEIRVKSFETVPDVRTLLANQSANGATSFFKLFVENGNLKLTLGAQTEDFGLLDTGYQHLVFTLNSTTNTVTLFKNGASGVLRSYPQVNQPTGPQRWTLGANTTASGFDQFFTGLIDEVAFYDSLLTQAEAQTNRNVGVQTNNRFLRSYFPINESKGDRLEDIGRDRTGFGAVEGALWSALSANPNPSPHEFNPSQRLVTLNPSNTSVDNVDFTDLSTVPVTGYVRYAGTNCYAENVEILVNGASYSPPAYTDTDGKFVIDLEPGVSVRLTPVFKTHQFAPAFWDIQNINAPVSGLLFENTTKRTLSGIIAGGLCRSSILRPNQIMKLQVETLDGCLEREISISDPDGRFLLTGLPPVPFTVGVSEHSDPVIFDYFATRGGQRADLTDSNAEQEFIYFAPLSVELTPLDFDSILWCGAAYGALYQADQYRVNVRVYEEYAGSDAGELLLERCYLDTALLTITNNIAEDLNQFDTLMTGGRLVHRFRAGVPNIVAPYLKSLQVSAEYNNREGTANTGIVVLGTRPRVSTFTTVAPAIPTLILRDPPGDASSATVSKGTTICSKMNVKAVDTDGEVIGDKVSLAPTWNVTTGLFGYFVGTETNIVVKQNNEFTTTTTSLTESSLATCFTTNETISTSGGATGIGADGDVFMGGAMNLVYGATDIVLFDSATCAFIRDTGLVISPQGFATTFVYSRAQIVNDVIPSATLIGDTIAARQWRRILEQDSILQAEAVFRRNLSFDAGAGYQYDEEITTSSSRTITSTTQIDQNFAQELGLFINNVGGQVDFSFSFSEIEEETTIDDTTQTVVTTFILGDKDAGDNFSVDVLHDATYQTPVFRLKAGETSCPWEAGSLNREEVSLFVPQTQAINVPSHEPAIFNIKLGNISQSEEERIYYLRLVPGSNPGGAIVKANGFNLENETPFSIPFGEPQDVLLTVERGPLAYDYEDIQVAFYSGCEYGGGVAGPDPDPRFYQTASLDVSFIEPCSEVDLSFPQPGWVVTNNPLVSINLSGYDETDPDLELILVQYRNTTGNGIWINLDTVLKADLGPVNTLVPWNTTGLSDARYELRAVSQCTGQLPAGFSDFIPGKIERTAPELFGAPEPADGVLSPGDQISVVFSEDIACDELFPAFINAPGNIGLYDVATGNLVGFTFVCQGNKIIITPTDPNTFLENRILRAEVTDVEDLVGNVAATIEWSFVVDRNGIQWLDGDLQVSTIEKNALTVIKRIQNRSGQPMNYSIDSIPDWANVYPDEGILQPGQQAFITFFFPTTLPVGQYADTIFLNTPDGDEPLAIDLRVLCSPPDWLDFDPAAFSASMNFTALLNIEGDLSTDEADLVAAFIDGELRGVAPVRYLPSLDTFMAFLTVYGETGDNGKPIDLEIWDASACLRYGEVVEQFDFLIDDVIGSLGNPQVLNTNSNIRRDIPLGNGWNWISFNLDFPDPALDAALGTLAHPQNDLIKTLGDYAEYLSAGNTWVGDLAELDNTRLFQYRADQPDTIRMSGALIDPATVPIPVNTGWNWIGYVPNYALPVSQALAGLNPLNGDIIKGQTAFAQYLAGFGWLGSLQFLEAPKGYQLRISNPGTLTYPAANVHNPAVVQTRGDQSASFWNINPAQYEHTMTLTGAFSANGQNATESAFELGAFVGNELRGSAQALYVQPLGVHLYFLTMYANAAGEQVTFRQYDAATGEIMPLSEQLFFTPNQHVGSAVEPYLFTAASSSTGSAAAPDLYLNVQPNPFESDATIRFHSLRSQAVALSVTDALGRQVLRENVQAAAGDNAYVWHAHGLSAGLYLIRLETADGSAVQQVVKR
ncbi:MAG: LamG-like jellyroll fold domain-containing protein [Saprospiraceae bacterium]|nr:LamG-like jellyroll fold domain-containing protein [Saprospiraceae bacterium]